MKDMRRNGWSKADTLKAEIGKMVTTKEEAVDYARELISLRKKQKSRDKMQSMTDEIIRLYKRFGLKLSEIYEEAEK